MLVVIGLAAVALLGIGGFFAYQVAQDRARVAGDQTTSTEAVPSGQPPAPSSQGAAPEAPTAPTPPAADTAAAAPAAAPEPPRTEPGTDSTRALPSDTGPTPSPAAEHPAKARHRPAARPAAPRPPKVVAPVVNPPAAAPPVAPPRAAPALRPAPAVDRWTQMSDELARCTREDFINRVVCDQRVRLQFCNGYWGKVSQCPGPPTPDRGG